MHETAALHARSRPHLCFRQPRDPYIADTAVPVERDEGRLFYTVRVTRSPAASRAIPICAAAAALLIGVGAPSAQTPAFQSERRLRSSIELTVVTATVRDADGRPVTGLDRDRFEVYEDGERQALTQFTHDRVPLGLGLLLDISDSMFGERLRDARTAVERFLFQLLSPSDEFFVLAFNHEPHVLTGWTATPPVVSRALAWGYRGFNVTIPHKRAVLTLPQVLEIDPAAGEIGAANTLALLPGGGLKAINTDWRGFQEDLEAHRISTKNLSCLVLGTGGSARAVAYALSSLGARQVWFASRQPQPQACQVGYGDLGELLVDTGLIVNCTPVGMSPSVDACPWPESAPFPEGALVYDLIYIPPVTRLMVQARRAGIRAIGGLGMLVRQGAASFRQWTGAEPPLAIMLEAARRALVQPKQGRPRS